MSILKNHQKEKLKTGAEQINYKVYSSEGTYKTNEDKKCFIFNSKAINSFAQFFYEKL